MCVFRFDENDSTFLINLDNVKEIEKCGKTIYLRFGNNFTRTIHLLTSEKCTEIFEFLWDRMYQEKQQTIDR